MEQRLALVPRKLVELLLECDSVARRLSADERRADDAGGSDKLALVLLKEILGRKERLVAAALDISGSLHCKMSLKRHQAKDANGVEGGNAAKHANEAVHGDEAEHANVVEHGD